MKRALVLGPIVAVVCACGSAANGVGRGDGAAGGSAGSSGGAAAGSSTGGTSLGGSSASGGAPGAGGTSGAGAGGGAAGGTTGFAGAGTGGIGTGGSPTCEEGLALSAGVWTDITPPGLNLSTTFGVNDVEVAPSDPCILYAAVDQNGMYKSTNAGASWDKLGTGSPSNGTSTTILDSPLHMRIDPNDANHLYAVQGVRGTTEGFWVTTDGGDTWTMPQAFADGASVWTRDVYSVNYEPGDFDHILLTFHYGWSNNASEDSGVVESTDGGATWETHYQAGFSHGNVATFLSNGQTWLLGTQDHGFWRTSDGGSTWNKVTDNSMSHGGVQLYRSQANDALYAGIWNGLLRSTDDGITWKSLNGDNGIAYTGYMAVIGDGTNLFTMTSCACMGTPKNDPYITSAESDGLSWAQYNGGDQKFGNGPFSMSYAPGPGIIYSANWDAGVWALKIAP